MLRIIRIGWAFLTATIVFSGSPLVRAVAMATDPPTAPGAALSPPMADILDIKPPVPYGFDPALLTVAAAVTAAALIAAFFYWRRRRRKKNTETAVPPAPAHEEALAALGDLAGMPESRGKEFYFRLGEVLRRYLQRRFQVGAPEMTTEELVPRIDGLPVAEIDSQALKALLRTGDLVKFADAPAAAGQMKTDLFTATAFVTGTAPTSENALASSHDNAALPARVPSRCFTSPPHMH